MTTQIDFSFAYIRAAIIVLVWAATPVAMANATGNTGRALYPFFADGKWGVINGSGDIVAPAKFDKINEVWGVVPGCRELRTRTHPMGSEGPVAVQSHGDWAFVGATGFIPDAVFGDMHPFKAGLAAVKLSGKWGFIDATGKTVIPFRYDYAFGFVGGATPVMVDGWWGLINTQGDYMIDPIYDRMRPTGSGPYFEVETKTKIGVVNAQGEIVVEPKFDAVYPISEGMAGVNVDGRKGYYDVKTKKVVIEPIYDVTAPFSGGIAEVRLEGKTGFINWHGEVTVEFRKSEKRPFPGYLPFQYGFPQNLSLRRYRLGKFMADAKWGLIDPRDGNIIIEPTLDWLGPLHDGRAVFQDGKKFGYLNKLGEIAIPAQFTHADDFANGLAAVRFEGGFGYIDTNGDLVMKFDEPWLTGGRFLPDLALVNGDGLDRYIDRQGRTIFEFQSGCK